MTTVTMPLETTELRPSGDLNRLKHGKHNRETHDRSPSIALAVPATVVPLGSLPITPLRDWIHALGNVAVALSGGVDSTLLAAMACDVLGHKSIALTGVSASLPSTDQKRITALCNTIGIAHLFTETDELSSPAYVKNTPNRCYHCKAELYDVLRQALTVKNASNGKQQAYVTLLDGTTADDLQGHRPGHQAAKERGVRSPYVELGIGKQEIRAMAKIYNLPNFDLPSSPCLSSRIAYGDSVTVNRLQQIEKAEKLIRDLGFRSVRVRLHGETARIEIPPKEFSRLIPHADNITSGLKSLGFVYVTLDLQGYRSGSLLEVLP